MSVCGMCFAEAHLGETSLNGNCYFRNLQTNETQLRQAKWSGAATEERAGGRRDRQRPPAPRGAAAELNPAARPARTKAPRFAFWR